MAPARFLQVSDLHAGTREEPEVGGGLRAARRRVRPGARRRERRPDAPQPAASSTSGRRVPALARAAAPRHPREPRHPALPPARFTRTFRASRRSGRHRARLPLRTARRRRAEHRPAWKYQRGALSRRPARARARASSPRSPEGALRVVALHHHLRGRRGAREADDRRSRRASSPRSSTRAPSSSSPATSTRARCWSGARSHGRGRAELRGRRLPGPPPPAPEPPGRGGGLHAIEADAARLSIRTYVWQRGELLPVAERSYPRDAGPLALAVAARTRGLRRAALILSRTSSLGERHGRHSPSRARSRRVRDRSLDRARELVRLALHRAGPAARAGAP